jgi:hypothetical protein
MVVAAALPATVIVEMRHLQSQRSLPAFGVDEPAVSPLAKKLRLAPNHRVAVLNAPPGYLSLLQPGPSEVQVEIQGGQIFDAVLLFVNSVEELRTLGPNAIRAVAPEGLLWVAYPKGGKTVKATDLPATQWWTKRDVLGEVTGEKGYKPVAMVKIDEDRTALRFKRT